MPSEQQAPEAAQAGQHGSGGFATTHWSMVVEAGRGSSAEARVALEELCRTYWSPLYAFVRRQGMTTEDAEDAVQGFFEDLLSRGAIASADASRGRFRTFLISSFRNFNAQQYRALNRKKRGGGQTILSLGAIRSLEEAMRDEQATNDSPERTYDRKWVAQLLQEVLSIVRREYGSVGKEALFDELRTSFWSGRRKAKYSDLAARLGLTESAIKSAAHRLRKRIGEQIRSEVAKTVVDPNDVEDEVRCLMTVFSA